MFSLGLILVIVGGAELLTGNMALVPMAVFAKRVTVAKMAMNWLWVTIGNLAGSLFVAYFLADQTGVLGSGTPGFIRLGAIASGKAATETHWEQFLRAVGCNWLVCLAVWLALAATDIGGKILAIIFPITAFVALGFDHVVANMFFLPAAMFLNTGNVSGQRADPEPDHGVPGQRRRRGVVRRRRLLVPLRLVGPRSRRHRRDERCGRTVRADRAAARD